jgi:hypothetical protein
MFLVLYISCTEDFIMTFPYISTMYSGLVHWVLNDVTCFGPCITSFSKIGNGHSESVSPQ